MKHLYEGPTLEVRYIKPSSKICTTSEDGLDWGDLENSDSGDEADAFTL